MAFAGSEAPPGCVSEDVAAAPDVADSAVYPSIVAMAETESAPLAGSTIDADV
jgi:hypothetical protein